MTGRLVASESLQEAGRSAGAAVIFVGLRFDNTTPTDGTTPRPIQDRPSGLLAEGIHLRHACGRDDRLSRPAVMERETRVCGAGTWRGMRAQRTGYRDRDWQTARQRRRCDPEACARAAIARASSNPRRTRRERARTRVIRKVQPGHPNPLG